MRNGFQNYNGSKYNVRRECRFHIYGVDDALLIASIAATVGSAGAGMAAQEKSKNAVASARNAELNRQQKIQNKADAVAQKSISESGADNAAKEISKGANQRAAEFSRLTEAVSPQQSARPGNRLVAPASPTAAANTSQNALSEAWNRIIGGAQAKLGGYSDWGLARSIAAQRAGSDLGVIAGEARGSEAVLGTELANAQHAGDNLALLGTVLGAAGSVAGAARSVYRPPTVPTVAGANPPGNFSSFNPETYTLLKPVWGIGDR